MNAQTPALTVIEPEQRQVAVTPMQLLQIATEKGADIEKLQQLMALQERWEANEARKAYVVAVAAFKADPPAITKNKLVSFGSGQKTEYHHATLDHVCDAIVPALSKQGLSHRWETEQLEGGIIRVSCILTHIQGHSERTSLQSGADQSGSKNNIQAIGSATTYLQRYTLLAACGLATGGLDDDGRKDADFVTTDQADTLQALVESVGADKAKFLAFFGAESYGMVPANRFKEAVAKLNQKAGAKK